MNSSAGPDFAYGAALESTATLSLHDRYGLFIGGQWQPASDGATFITENPATEEALALVSLATEADVDRAVRAARRGYEKYWRKLRPSERAKHLYRFARAIEERSREFALTEALDAGMPIRQAREFEVPEVSAHVFYHAGWADKLAWAVPGGERVRPLGVVAAVVSSSLPLLAAAWKAAPALACGNAVVLKPARTTPLGALLLAAAAAEADLPPGVLNVVTGDARTGAVLVEHPDVDGVAFSGATEAGKAVRRATAGTGKRLGLSLAGKSAVIVYDDAPFDQAVEGIVSAIFFNGGQAGSAGSRLLVQENVAAEVIARLEERLGSLRHGNPLDANTDVGPLVSRARRDRIAEVVRAGVEDGATLTQAPWTPPESGYWFPASFLANVRPGHRLAREEALGPVLAILTFRTPDEAIARANSLPFALAAGIWTSSGALAFYTAERVKAGVVWCNSYHRFAPSSAFGGNRESGLGRDGGLAGLRPYLHV